MYDPRAHGAQCEVCGATLVRRDREKPYAFRARRTCGKRCAIQLTRPKSRWAEMSLEERFWCRVRKTSGCWVWIGARCGRNGEKRYGTIRADGVQTKTHVLSWRLAYGDIPEGQLVLHHCDNPPCVRPDHLFLGTHQDNTHDAFHKGRRPYRLTYEQVAFVRESRTRGVTYSEIAAALQVAESVIWKALRGYATR